MAAGSGDDDAPRPNPLPSSLVSNLQSVLAARRHPPAEGSDPAAADAEAEPPAEAAPAKPAVIVTCSGGIQSLGLAALVDALAAGGSCDVHVCAPDSDKSSCGHSVTVHETVAATLVEFARAKAFEVSGTPVDCVSLALSGRLFPWSAPALVISGINARSNCGHETFYSSAIAAAREALMCGVPSIAISLNWKKDESKDSDFKDAADVCLPLIHVALTDIEKGTFLKGCLLNIGIPSSPTSNKGFKLTKQSLCSPAQIWLAVPSNRPSSAAHFMGMHQSLGIQLAQLGKDASTAGAARRINAQRKTVEVESVAAAGKPEAREVVKKFFRAEFLQKEHEDLDEKTDLRALENGFISVTPLHIHSHVEPENGALASQWLSAAVSEEKEAPAA